VSEKTETRTRKQLGLLIDCSLYRRIKVYAATHDTSMGEIVRTALTIYMARRAPVVAEASEPASQAS